MIDPKNYIDKNRAALFDWSIISISFMLGFIFPTFKDFITSPKFSYWMLIAFLLYTSGAILKHLPLSYRMAFSGANPRPVPYVIFLFVGHWFLLFIVLLFSEAAFRHIFSLPPMAKENSASWQLILASTTTAAFVTWLVYRNKSNRESRKKYSESNLFYRELVADIFLIAGVSILSFVLWEKGVIAMLARVSTKSISEILFLFVFLSITFLFCYLPLRYLYFIEDREGGRNRRRLLYIFAFILLRALFEIIGASVVGKHIIN
jgi:hypothetical protein